MGLFAFLLGCGIVKASHLLLKKLWGPVPDSSALQVGILMPGSEDVHCCYSDSAGPG